MSVTENTEYFGSNNRSFWRRHMKSLPGCITPASRAELQASPECSQAESVGKDIIHPTTYEFSSTKHTSHQEDDTSDDLLLGNCGLKISRQAVYSTAAKVLQIHSEQQKLSNEQRITNKDQPTADCELSLPCVSPNAAPSSLATPRLFGPGVGMRLDLAQSSKEPSMANEHEQSKVDKFSAVLSAASVDLDELRKLSWSGIPPKCRPASWKLLSGYMSPMQDRQKTMLERKRLEYQNFVNQYYNTRHQDIHQETYRQIHIDIPRMSPLNPLFQQLAVQQVFERILYIWAIRHPASGYVQGINDLVTPFFVVFLTEYIDEGSQVSSCQLSSLSAADIQKLEADSFWCFSKLLDGIQDNYTFAQPGIQIRVNSLKELISRIDYNLHRHLELVNIEYLQFAFRWMNNLLMREIPLQCVIRLWDTYMCEINGFSCLHLYVCVAFLTRFSTELQQENDFHNLLVLLQNLPTEHWADEEIGVILADAYRLKYMFADAPRHLQ